MYINHDITHIFPGVILKNSFVELVGCQRRRLHIVQKIAEEQGLAFREN